MGEEAPVAGEPAMQEDVAGPVGGQLGSFDWVFSPRGPDGRPMKLFNGAGRLEGGVSGTETAGMAPAA